MANRGRYTESEACRSRENCVACRTDTAYRRRAMELWDWDSTCPFGYAGEGPPPPPPREGPPCMGSASDRLPPCAGASSAEDYGATAE